MRPFKEYLSESAKKYDFRVKIAGTVDKDCEAKLESALSKFKASSFKKVATTPVQSLPLDFPKLQNESVNIYEISLDYPTTQEELRNYLGSHLQIARENLVIRMPGEPLEEYQEPGETREGALLNDPDYKEAGNPQFEDYYGDKYNQSFLKELNDVLKLQRRERGEEIPSAQDSVVGTDAQAKYNTDSEQNTKSPLMQAQDPRK